VKESLFEKVKNTVRIDEVMQHFGVVLDRALKARCPFHEERTPSFSVKKNENIFKCFGCDEGGDAIDFVAKIKGVEPLEAARLLADIYGISVESQPHHSGKTRGDKIRGQEQKSGCVVNSGAKRGIKDYILRCHAAVSQTDYYKSRGLTDDTLRRFYLGYDAEKRQVVIPYSSKLEYYQTRSVGDKKFFKPRTEDAGAEPLWGGEMLKTKGIVFVVESPICAMSVVQCGGAAIATCGTSGINKIATEIKSKKPNCIFVLSLDNDEAGRKAQQDLANALFEEGVKFTTYNIAGECKDANELLIHNPKALSEKVKAAGVAARREFSKLKKLFSAAELQKRELKSTRWIVHEILPEGLAILCAPSKYGKSWMMMQLCLAIATGRPFLERKTEQSDCAYYSLEDSLRRFKSRLNKQMNGASAPRGFMGAVECRTMANGLFEELTELLETYPDMGLIIIDTFQKIRGGVQKNESIYSADYREMGEIKAFADKHGICILLVHHLRKQSDDADIFNRISGSMAIMGASDTSWVMARKKRDDTNTTLSVTGREVEEVDLIITFDKASVRWELIGNADQEASRLARAEYENNAVIKTIKSLVEKNSQGWRGNCTDIKTKIYEETGVLYTKSVESIGKAINYYQDRLLADGILHTAQRNKFHLFVKKQSTLYGYMESED